MDRPQSPVALSPIGPGDREVEHYLLATVRWEVQNEKIPRVRLGTRVSIVGLTAEPRDRKIERADPKTQSRTAAVRVKGRTSMRRVNRPSSC